MGSGEWLTILVAIVGPDGQQVQPALRQTAIRAMYGVQAAHFSGLVTLVQESLQDYLKEWRSFAGWQPPLTSVRLGEVRTLLADDAMHALRQLIVLHASLSAHDETDEIENESPDLPGGYWWKDVKSIVAARRPNLASRFNVRIDGRTAGYRFRLGFFDQGLAAHFGLVRPDRLTPDGRDLKAKLWEFMRGRFDVREADLVLCVPPPITFVRSQAI